MRVLILAEDYSASRLLGHMVKELLPLAELQMYEGVADVTDLQKAAACDIAFVGIETVGGDGLILANQLRKLNPHINLIFSCASDAYMKEALELRASGYLRPPFCKDEVKRELNHLRYPGGEPVEG